MRIGNCDADKNVGVFLEDIFIAFNGYGIICGDVIDGLIKLWKGCAGSKAKQGYHQSKEKKT